MINQQHAHRSTIPPISEDLFRPCWSVMIPTYNCAGYLRETLISVLSQDPGSDIMQIEVVDDHSTQDDPEAVVKELGQGRVNFYRQPQNVGHVKNFQTCLERSQGRLIHLLHGDDRILYGFYAKLQQAFETHPEIGATFCRHIFIDELGHWQWLSGIEQSDSGILNNWLERIAVEQRIQTPSIVVRRDVYERLGGFDNRIRHWGEDWEMWVRIAAQYPVWYEVEPLALYRMRSLSLSGHSTKTGENIQDICKAIEIIKEYLPQDVMAKLSKTARQNYALFALTTARKFAAHDDIQSSINQLRAALQCCSSFNVLRSSLRLSLRIFVRMLKLTLTQTQSGTV